jgi:hypothetical protein
MQWTSICSPMASEEVTSQTKNLVRTQRCTWGMQEEGQESPMCAESTQEGQQTKVRTQVGASPLQVPNGPEAALQVPRP